MGINYTTKLYFECHVNFKPISPDFRDLLEKICQFHGFRLARLLNMNMTNSIDTFCTTRGTVFKDVLDRTRFFITETKVNGFDSTRYKIENTLIDSKIRDDFGLLK
jgi:hypothetical protein